MRATIRLSMGDKICEGHYEVTSPILITFFLGPCAKQVGKMHGYLQGTKKVTDESVNVMGALANIANVQQQKCASCAMHNTPASGETPQRKGN